MAGIVLQIWGTDKYGNESVLHKAVECSSGHDPNEVAEENGGTVVGYYSSLAAARFAIANDPTGKVDTL